MSRIKKTSGGTTVENKPAMTTKSAVEKKNQSVSPTTKKKKINLDELPVYDPGSEKDNDIFVDNIFDTDDYEDL